MRPPSKSKKTLGNCPVGLRSCPFNTKLHLLCPWRLPAQTAQTSGQDADHACRSQLWSACMLCTHFFPRLVQPTYLPLGASQTLHKFFWSTRSCAYVIPTAASVPYQRRSRVPRNSNLTGRLLFVPSLPSPHRASATLDSLQYSESWPWLSTVLCTLVHNYRRKPSRIELRKFNASSPRSFRGSNISGKTTCPTLVAITTPPDH